MLMLPENLWSAFIKSDSHFPLTIPIIFHPIWIQNPISIFVLTVISGDTWLRRKLEGLNIIAVRGNVSLSRSLAVFNGVFRMWECWESLCGDESLGITPLKCLIVSKAAEPLLHVSSFSDILQWFWLKGELMVF